MYPGWCELTGCGGYIRLRERIPATALTIWLGLGSMAVPVWMWVAASVLIAVVAAETVLSGRDESVARWAVVWIGIYVSLAGCYSRPS